MVRTRWIVLGVLGLAVAAPLALAAPLPAGHVVDVAERFRPSGYTETVQNVEPRRLWCLGDNKCPSVHQTWKFDTYVTNDQLAGWLTAAGYDAAVDGDCADAAVGSTITCSATGTYEGRDIAVYVRIDNTARSSRMSLSVS